MKKLIILMFFTLNACSHVYVQKSGGGEVTTCCPSGKLFCNREKMDDLAKEQCNGEATAVSFERMQSGASMQQGFGGADVRMTSDACATYRCGH